MADHFNAARYLDERCGCSKSGLGRRPVADIRSYSVQIVDGIPGKAQVYPGTGQIQVDRRFWASTTQAQKDAVLAHEMAHDEDPSDCEHCADARAGARLRWMGYSAQTSVDALASVVSSRKAGAAVLAGWQAADETIREMHSQTAGIPSGPEIAPGEQRRGFVAPKHLGGVKTLRE